MHGFTTPRARLALSVAALTAWAMAAAVLPQALASPGSSQLSRSSQVTAQADAVPGKLTSRVRGTFGNAGTVRGTFQPARFFVRGGDAYAFGVLQAVLRDGNGEVIGKVTRKVTLPVKNARTPATTAARSSAATCDILHLVLGPLDLNLLGLEIHLNRVVLDIVATTGAGNLLGNLLCAVVGLLDGTGLLNELRLVNVLNRILSILRLT